MIFNTELNLYAFVGVIMLVGLVKKNGIMMVDFAVEAQRHGKTPVEAIHEACLVRFRPIMMTTMAALVGTLPIALRSEEHTSELQSRLHLVCRLLLEKKKKKKKEQN